MKSFTAHSYEITEPGTGLYGYLTLQPKTGPVTVAGFSRCLLSEPPTVEACERPPRKWLPGLWEADWAVVSTQ